MNIGTRKVLNSEKWIVCRRWKNENSSNNAAREDEVYLVYILQLDIMISEDE